MEHLKVLRRQEGLSQRALARRAGLAYKTVQLLEKGGRGWRWSTLTKLAKALGVARPQDFILGFSEGPFLTAAGAVDKALQGGEDSWKLWLFEFVDAFRRSARPGLAARAPSPEASERLLALTASTVESLCAERGQTSPWWCAGVPPLVDPWFTAGVENLKAAALAESPAAFRKRNIFVLANFLTRA